MSNLLRNIITNGFSDTHDRLWRVTYQNGEVAAVTDYNCKITGWSDNAPIEFKEYGRSLWTLSRKYPGFKLEHIEDRHE